MDNIFLDDDIPLGPLPSDDVEPASNAAIDLILLDGKKVRIFRTGGSAVRATITDERIGAPRTYLRVQIARAYPLSDPDRFIGFRDDKDKDIGMLATLTALDATSRQIIADELDRRYFIPKVLRVRNVKDEFGTITWDVETDRGDRTFYLQNFKESVIELSPSRLLVTDRDGSRWEFPDVRKLDSKAFIVLQKVLS